MKIYFTEYDIALIQGQISMAKRKPVEFPLLVKFFTENGSLDICLDKNENRDEF